MRLAVGGVEHLLAVAVVGGNQHFAAGCLGGSHDFAHAVVERFHRFDGGGQHAAVPDHVAVGEVAQNHVETLGGEAVEDVLAHLRRAHFGLQIVGGDFGRGHEDALFAGIGLFTAAAEEVGNVRIFLGFGNAQLADALGGQVFAQAVADAFLGKQHREVVLAAVAGERGEIAGAETLLAREALEIVEQ